jgi:hypothetical protein
LRVGIFLKIEDYEGRPSHWSYAEKKANLFDGSVQLLFLKTEGGYLQPEPL